MGKTGKCIKCGLACWPKHQTCWDCREVKSLARFWHTKAWRERREVVIARTNFCEKCGTPFNGSPKIVNHKLDDYAAEPSLVERYAQMVDDEVEVICRSCNYRWTRSAPLRRSQP